MNLILRTQGQVKITDSVKEHINKQIKPLEKMFNSSENVNFNLLCSENNKKSKAEITIVLKHVVLRAECTGDTLYAAIDQAVDKIEQQLIRHKGKVNAMIKKRDGVAEYFANVQAEVKEPVEEEKVVKEKRIELMEMSVEEAIVQMELVDHEFFLFKNEETHTASVVYKRQSGGYGLLEAIE